MADSEPPRKKAKTEEETACEWLALLQRNAEWSKKTDEEDPTYFPRLAASQSPPFLYIGCSDSRLPLTNFTQSGPGQFFVHRNIANQIHGIDMNFLSTLEYAVKHLKVRHIIVSGHYQCGGVHAAMSGTNAGLIGNWVQPVRRIFLKSKDSLMQMSEDERWKTLVETNVVQQVKHLLNTQLFTEHLFEGIPLPTVHGVIIDLKHGLLKELNIPFEHWKSKGLIPSAFNNNGYKVGDAHAIDHATI